MEKNEVVEKSKEVENLSSYSKTPIKGGELSRERDQQPINQQQ